MSFLKSRILLFQNYFGRKYLLIGQCRSKIRLHVLHAAQGLKLNDSNFSLFQFVIWFVNSRRRKARVTPDTHGGTTTSIIKDARISNMAVVAGIKITL